eukprot:415989-Pyramimonas_sp.AAC.1
MGGEDIDPFDQISQSSNIDEIGPQDLGGFGIHGPPAGGGGDSEEAPRPEEEQRMNTIEAKTDEKKRKGGGRDTTIFGHVWEATSLIEDGNSHDTETPDYISANAAYQVSEVDARALGKMFENAVGTVERFYCMAYRIDPGDRRRCMGRGQGYKLEGSDNRARDKGEVQGQESGL